MVGGSNGFLSSKDFHFARAGGFRQLMSGCVRKWLLTNVIRL